MNLNPLADRIFKVIEDKGFHDIQHSQRESLTFRQLLHLVTEWNEFRRPDFDAVKERLRHPVIFDGRNIWPRATLEEQGFTYYGIGR